MYNKSHTTQHTTPHHTGIVVGVPNPCPGDSEALQDAIDLALQSADKEGVRGSSITPYILAMVEKLTKGISIILF